MKSKKGKAILHSVGLTYGIRDKDMKDLVYSAFIVVRQSMESGDRKLVNFENVQLLNFGKFFVSEGRRKYLRKLNNKK